MIQVTRNPQIRPCYRYKKQSKKTIYSFMAIKVLNYLSIKLYIYLLSRDTSDQCRASRTSYYYQPIEEKDLILTSIYISLYSSVHGTIQIYVIFISLFKSIYLSIYISIYLLTSCPRKNKKEDERPLSKDRYFDPGPVNIQRGIRT